jgi:hypothetical protein
MLGPLWACSARSAIHVGWPWPSAMLASRLAAGGGMRRRGLCTRRRAAGNRSYEGVNLSIACVDDELVETDGHRAMLSGHGLPRNSQPGQQLRRSWSPRRPLLPVLEYRLIVSGGPRNVARKMTTRLVKEPSNIPNTRVGAGLCLARVRRMSTWWSCGCMGALIRLLYIGGTAGVGGSARLRSENSARLERLHSTRSSGTPLWRMCVVCWTARQAACKAESASSRSAGARCGSLPRTSR